MIRIRASAPSARAISTSCCSGIVSRRTSVSGSIAAPIRSSSRRARVAPLAPADAPPGARPAPARARCSRRPSGRGTGPAAGRSRRSRARGRGPGRCPRRPGRRTSSVPSSGAWAPVMTLIRVDFPAPFSPTSAWTSPASRSNETPLRARTPANDLLMPVSRNNVGNGRPLDLTIEPRFCQNGARGEEVRTVAAYRGSRRFLSPFPGRPVGISSPQCRRRQRGFGEPPGRLAVQDHPGSPATTWAIESKSSGNNAGGSREAVGAAP